MSDTNIAVTVKWNGAEYLIENLNSESSIYVLKQQIYDKTGVLPARQKLMGLKVKDGVLTDESLMSSIVIKPKMKIMMIGSKEENIDEVNKRPDDVSEVVDDIDIVDPIELPEFVRVEYQEKVQKRVESYKINILNEPRLDKRLLVLDIDYTLFDHRSPAETVEELRRPFLHEFLTSAYESYDIVIWSATGMRWIETKMRELGVLSHPDYKICFMLDDLAMITISSKVYGLVNVKPLGVIWGKFPQWSPKNSIMFDDIRRNFLMNPQSGLKIRPFKKAHTSRNTDRELLGLSQYLLLLVGEPDFETLNHNHWERYCQRRLK